MKRLAHPICAVFLSVLLFSLACDASMVPTSTVPQQTPKETRAAQQAESLLDIPAPPDVSPTLSGVPYAQGDFILKPWRREEVGLGKITLEAIPQDSFKDSEGFYLNEGEWVDIVVSGQLPVFWYTEQPEGISFHTFCKEINAEVEGFTAEPCTPTSSAGIVIPVAGKCHFENFYSNGTYVTAIRLFAWNKADTYYIHFQNCSQEVETTVSYRIFRVTSPEPSTAVPEPTPTPAPTPTPIPPATPAEPVLPEPPPAPPTIVTISPNGGEVWYVGTTQAITWVSNVGCDTVEIWVSRDGGSSWSIITSRSPNDGAEPWQVTGPATTEARIKIVSGPGVSDTSDNNFVIAPPIPTPTPIPAPPPE